MTRTLPHSRTKQVLLSPDEEWAESISARVLADCHPFQRAAVLDPAKRYSLLTGRGGGKTTTFRARGVRKLTRKAKAKVLYLALTRPHAEDLMWIPLKETLDKLSIAADFNETKLRCTIRRTGSVYQLSGMDDKREIEKWRGQSFDEMQGDECASVQDKLLDSLVYRIVGPRLGDRDGCIGLGGTPGHILSGLFWEVTRDGGHMHMRAGTQDDDWKGWVSHWWNLELVSGLEDAHEKYPALVALWKEALLEKERNQWTDDNPVWRREYLGLWAADDTENVFRYRAEVDGVEHNRWDPERVGPLRFGKLPDDLKDIHYAIGMDQGYKDPFACNVFAFSPIDKLRRIFHVFGFEKTQMYARLVAELLIGKDEVERVLAGKGGGKPGGVFGVTGWPDAIVADADEAWLAELRNVYGISIAKAEKNANYKAGAIELVNGDLVDGRLKVLKDSELERQMLNLQWKVDEDTRMMKEDKAQPNHSTDSAIYARRDIAKLFASEPDPSAKVGSGSYTDPQGLDAEYDDPEPRRSFESLYEDTDRWDGGDDD